MGEKQRKPFQLTFNGLLTVDFQGSRVTSGGGLILASMRRLVIVKRGSRGQLQLLANVRARFHPHSGGVIFRTRCSMKFGPGGAARSVSASRAGRGYAVTANTVSDVLGHCRCSPVSIAKPNRSSRLGRLVYVVLGFLP